LGNGDVWEAVNGLRGDIKELLVNGCAKREGDMVRIKAVEDASKDHGKKLDKIYYSSLVTAGGIIAFLLKAFLPVLLGKSP
jgi:hypothetical protein